MKNLITKLLTYFRFNKKTTMAILAVLAMSGGLYNSKDGSLVDLLKQIPGVGSYLERNVDISSIQKGIEVTTKTVEAVNTAKESVKQVQEDLKETKEVISDTVEIVQEVHTKVNPYAKAKKFDTVIAKETKTIATKKSEIQTSKAKQKTEIKQKVEAISTEKQVSEESIKALQDFSLEIKKEMNDD